MLMPLVTFEDLRFRNECLRPLQNIAGYQISLLKQLKRFERSKNQHVVYCSSIKGQDLTWSISAALLHRCFDKGVSLLLRCAVFFPILCLAKRKRKIRKNSKRAPHKELKLGLQALQHHWMHAAVNLLALGGGWACPSG